MIATKRDRIVRPSNRSMLRFVIPSEVEESLERSKAYFARSVYDCSGDPSTSLGMTKGRTRVS
ncbi:MAG: hypothetical protein M3O82_03815 [Verrucomicrobiota bacterium]|nr:hypothetical protein [Verrucomicrobiota bacterium]